MNATTIRIGGVPEHFNIPVHLAKKKKQFEKRGVNMKWTTFKGGTGQMTKALREGEVDLCILLTEGIITDIINGNPSKIISKYVTTPLTWGIHTGAKNELRHHSDIYDKRYAISRFGSGSHLMSIVDAHGQGHTIDKSQFNVIKNLEGARKSLTALETDVFYWEKYTTKPFVYSGELRRVGQFQTPWPCFVIAATDAILKREPESVIRALRTIHDSCDYFMQNEEAIPLVSELHDLPIKDAEKWYHSTEWAIDGWVQDKMLKNVLYYLHSAEIVKKGQEIPELIWRR